MNEQKEKQSQTKQYACDCKCVFVCMFPNTAAQTKVSDNNRLGKWKAFTFFLFLSFPSHFLYLSLIKPAHSEQNKADWMKN